MGLTDFGKLAKLKIIANDDEENAFEVMFNPESYSEKFSVAYKKIDAVDTGWMEYRYIKSEPRDFSIKIIIDGTGVTDYHAPNLPGFKGQDEFVYDEVERFLVLTWAPAGGELNPLKIKWGKLVFTCRLKSVDIKYTLFIREGIPIRAEMDATFISSELEKEEKKDKKGRNGKEKKKKTKGIVIKAS